MVKSAAWNNSDMASGILEFGFTSKYSPGEAQACMFFAIWLLIDAGMYGPGL
jgi:hypothetical protein